MRYGLKGMALGAGMLFLATGPLAGQAWDTPSFHPPAAADELGLYLVSPDGADFGVMGIWRQTGPLNLGVRLGVLDLDNGTGAIVGVDARGLIARASPQFPVDVGWTLGLGANFNGETVLRIPFGASVGRAFDIAAPVVFYPYVHPRFGLEINDDETDLNFTTDLGMDVTLSDNWMLRVGASLGELTGIGVGLSYLRARPVELARR